MKGLIRLLSFNSYEVAGLAGFLILGLALARDGLAQGDLVVLAAYALVTVWLRLVLRTPRAKLATFDTLAQFTEALGGRLPSLVEFYSDHCALGMAARPALDRLERDLAGRLRVFRIDVADPIGADLANRYSINTAPTFILFNANGIHEDQFSLRLDRARVVHWLDQQTIGP
jgi:thiol-disulfide isomerase/thioredoxin